MQLFIIDASDGQLIVRLLVCHGAFHMDWQVIRLVFDTLRIYQGRNSRSVLEQYKL